MYMKNFDTKPTTRLDYKGLQKDGQYIFSREGKYFAWFLVLGCIITSSVLLIYYGISFGMIKTYLWITSFVVMFFMSLFLTTPIRILILSFIKGTFFKLRVLLIKRPVSPSVLSNYLDPVKKRQVLNFRKYNSHLYKPMPLYKLQNRIQEIKYNLELRNLAVDIFTYVFFMITVFYVVLINKTELGHKSTGVIRNLVVEGSYTNTISFTNVTTYETLLEYLNYTLLPALLLSYTNYDKIFTEDWDEAPFEAERRRFVPLQEDGSKGRYAKQNRFEDPHSSFFLRGWTLDPAVKLIGRPRLRQIRVKGGTCVQLADLESRNLECAGELTIQNVETGNFTLRWDPWPAKGLTAWEEDPWIFKSGWETQTVPMSAEYSVYPWGGYIINLGRNLNDSRIVLDYLDHFEWIDMKTRAVRIGGITSKESGKINARLLNVDFLIFIEFTTYCVNSNVFNVVSLIAEKSAVGYIIPSFKIGTCRFLFLSVELQTLSIIMIFLFSVLLFFFFLREGIRMHRTSVRPYFRRTFAVLDLLIIFLGAICLTFIILRSYYVEKLLKMLEMSDNNKFVSFYLANFWDETSIYLEALLVCLASFKLYRLLTFRVVFFQLQTTLFCCCNQFLNLFVQIFVFTFGFSMFFHLFLNVYSYTFRSFTLSFSTMIGHLNMVEDDFITLMTFKDVGIFSSSRWYFAPLFFICFAVVVNILFMNLFIAVICLYFSVIRSVSLIEKYNMARYFKHVMTADRRGDLLQIKGDLNLEKEEKELLRLKGGGTKSSKEKPKKVQKIKKKNWIEEEEAHSTFLRDFVKERKYELTKFHALIQERALTMRYLTMSLLSNDKEVIKHAREKALLAYYLIVTSSDHHSRRVYNRDSYVLVVKEKEEDKIEKSPIHSKRLLEMKKIVEKYGIQKGWITEENPDDEVDSAERLKNDMEVLYRKVNSLLLNLQKARLKGNKKK